jgi:hypothetical protein
LRGSAINSPVSAPESLPVSQRNVTAKWRSENAGATARRAGAETLDPVAPSGLDR